MKKNPEPKPIKAVEMVRRIRDAHAEELAGATPAERLAFYRERGRQAQAELARLAREQRKGRRKAA
jgi:hypothetical protein